MPPLAFVSPFTGLDGVLLPRVVVEFVGPADVAVSALELLVGSVPRAGWFEQVTRQTDAKTLAILSMAGRSTPARPVAPKCADFFSVKGRRAGSQALEFPG
jgi:hypothetical protein